jgi:hypothetical protein
MIVSDSAELFCGIRHWRDVGHGLSPASLLKSRDHRGDGNMKILLSLTFLVGAAGIALVDGGARAFGYL